MGVPESIWLAMRVTAIVAEQENHPSRLKCLGRMADRSIAHWKVLSDQQLIQLANKLMVKIHKMSAHARARGSSRTPPFPLTIAAVQGLYEILDNIALGF